MATPHENMELVQTLTDLIHAHPMSARVTASPGYMRVLFPCGMYPDGAQVKWARGEKIIMLTRLLSALDKYWTANGINGYPGTPELLVGITTS